MKNPARLVFNPFAVNTYIIPCGGGKCILVDPACLGTSEEQLLDNFLSENKLTPVALITTHFHIDHIAGNAYIAGKYNLKVQTHKDYGLLWPEMNRMGAMLGVKTDGMPQPGICLTGGETISEGDTCLEIRHVPGHAAGSICLVNHNEQYVITGDVLFRDSIGRTDLPTGDYDTLRQSIFEKIFTLPDHYIVYPGHGPQTEVGYEKLNNPFLS